MASERVKPACHVTEHGKLRCDACDKRIPSVSVSKFAVWPKYPHCPWCGAAVTTRAQMKRRGL